ncbi:MAG: autotransporter-associated beta strand repeat-containing protein [Pirellulaceae bacterium]|nr:autotransporter-associated beta strand repeat-containing protein [Pirellulaceae bacterium]
MRRGDQQDTGNEQFPMFATWVRWSIWTAYLSAIGWLFHFPSVAAAAVNDLILNEYNAVAGNVYLDAETSTKQDEFFGRLEGNGQDWLEFLVVTDHLDLRGFQLDWNYEDSQNSQGSGTLTFSQDSIWSDLRQGSLVTITEWQESWYNDQNTVNTNFSHSGGVNGLGDDRGTKYDPSRHELFFDFSTDTAWSPETGDFTINIQAGERDPATGMFRYFDVTGTVTDVANNEVFQAGVDNDADLFVVNNESWDLTIKDSSSAVVQGPIGEVQGLNLGVNSREVGKFEGAFDNTLIGNTGSVAQYQATTVNEYFDGETSTFGARNLSNSFEQGLSGLRTWFQVADIIQRGTTTNGLAFNNNSAWLGGATPSTNQEAVFDQGSETAYTVLLGTNDDVHRLFVRNDRVDLDLNGNTLNMNATPLYEASVIGQSSGDVGELTLRGGGTLAATAMHVGEAAGSQGTLTVTGTGTSLALASALIVGGRGSTPGGSGTVTVDSDATVVISSADANVRETLKILPDSTVSISGGAVTVGSGAVETVAGALRVHADGTLDVRGGSMVASSIQLGGGAISGYGVLTPPIFASGSNNLFVPQFDDGLDGYLVLSGSLSGAGASFTKRGGGTLILSGSNSYSGSTTILDGIVQANMAAGLPASSTIRIRGGRLQGNGSFQRALGTGAGEVNWSDGTDSGGGGFSALGGNLTVNMGGGGATVTWDQGGFVPQDEVLHFSSNDADAQIEFVNAIDLGASGTNIREIRVANNGAAVNDQALLSGNLFNSGGSQGINKTGEGVLVLTGTNTYTGSTTIDNGELSANDGVGLPSASTLRFRGGMLLSQGSFSRNVGSSNGQVNWGDTTDNGDGGFAARGGSLDITLNGGASVIWGLNGFVPTGRDLLFGFESADDTVTFHNDMDIGGFLRTVRVFDNTLSSTDRAVMTGVISGTGGLMKEGAGDLELSAVNAYTGLTIVDNGRLTLTGSLAAPATVGQFAGISGNGTVMGDFVNAGNHDIRAVETLRITETATLQATSQIAVTESFSPTRGTETGNFQLLVAGTVVGQFATPPAAGTASHVGNGHFLRTIQYSPTDVTVNILAALPGDTDGNRNIDITDFNVLSTNFSPTGSSGTLNWTHANFDGDEDVDITDFNSLSANFVPSGYTSQQQFVPEPVSSLLWIIAGMVVASMARPRGGWT